MFYFMQQWYTQLLISNSDSIYSFANVISEIIGWLPFEQNTLIRVLQRMKRSAGGLQSLHSCKIFIQHENI